MKLQTYLCDGCKRMKEEVNHWWILDLHLAAPRSLTLQPWEDGLAAATPSAEWMRLHLCGEQCAQKKVSEFLREAKAA